MSVNHTTVWSEFTRIRDGKELKFRIIDLPRENIADLLEFFYVHLAPEEPLCKALGITIYAESFREYKEFIEHALERENVQISACYLLESEEMKLVGGSLMVLEREGEKVNLDELMKLVKTDALKKLLQVKFMSYIMASNIIKKYVKSYFSGRGISVSKDFRNLGIAGELLKSRVQACRHYGVQMTGAWLSSLGSQKAAAKLGWKTIYELNFDYISEAFDIKFDPTTPPTCKLMVFKV